MDYKRTTITAEIHSFAPGTFQHNLAEVSFENFKLEDLNLSSVDLSKMVLSYGDHLGKRELREIIAKESGVNPDEVILTSGAALALFIINTALLKNGDRVIGEHPNYEMSLEIPRGIGATVEYLDVTFENGYRPNIAELEAKLETKTKLVTLTSPHNPTGTYIPEADLKAIVEATKKKGAYLIVDEIYREFSYETTLPIGATLGNHVISVCSLSKAWGLPGIRMGWIICRDPALMEKFLAAKEQIVICGSVLDEEVAYQFVKKKHEFLPKIKASVIEKKAIMVEWMKQQEEYLEWVEPQIGVMCFPRLKTTDREKVEEFYRVLNKEYKTLVAPGHWFDMDRRYMRIGYGWPSKEALVKGLECVAQTLRKVFAK